MKELDRQKQGNRVSERLHSALSSATMGSEQQPSTHRQKLLRFLLRSKSKMCKERKVFVFSPTISFLIWNKDPSPGVVVVISHQRRQRTQVVEKADRALGVRVTSLSHTPNCEGAPLSSASQSSPEYAPETRKPSMPSVHLSVYCVRTVSLDSCFNSRPGPSCAQHVLEDGWPWSCSCHACVLLIVSVCMLTPTLIALHTPAIKRSFKRIICKPRLTHACNPCIWEAEAGRSL